MACHCPPHASSRQRRKTIFIASESISVVVFCCKIPITLIDRTASHAWLAAPGGEPAGGATLTTKYDAGLSLTLPEITGGCATSHVFWRRGLPHRRLQSGLPPARRAIDL